jgi:hypothetical protein
MKKLQLTLIAAFMSFAAVFGQGQTEQMSGSFSCKAKYATGKNCYLMDTCKVDFTYKLIMGNPAYSANVVWSGKDDFVHNKSKISYGQLSEFPDLKRRFELISPKSAKYTITVMFYSEKAKAYIASATTQIDVENLERAGENVPLPLFKKGDWKSLFSNVVIGKQNKEKPGVTIADAALDDFFKIERLTVGKLDNEARGFGFRLRRVFNNSTRMDVVKAEMSVEWDDVDYDYIVSEVKKKNESAKFFEKKDTAKAVESYYSNRKYPASVSLNQDDFWRTTLVPYEMWMSDIAKADDLFKKQKWSEASLYYKKALEADSTLHYSARKLAKIQEYVEYKSMRNVGDLELVYVEGSGNVKSFYISKTEITQSQWRRVMGKNPSGFQGCRDCPVENVSWEEALEFVKKLSEQTGMKYRLPRAVEWEYAANGGVDNVPSLFSGSNNLDEVAWCAYNSEDMTHSVANKAPNELGVYDMTGNVSEWVADSYDKNTRIVKGGSWADDAQNSAITGMEKFDLKHKSKFIGFRVCQDE